MAAFISAILAALISGVATWLAYGRTSKATLQSSDKMTQANTKNMYIAQYNNLFERVSKLEEQKSIDDKDMENSLMDRVALFYEIKSLEMLLKEHNIDVPKEAIRVIKNYGQKLHEDSRNSL